jgi:adenosylcobinamide kinase/adenosylcobinamide-phosphate guanylyltransferase
MDLLLTGTGPADGFPVPDCPCAPCRSALLGRPAGIGLPVRRPAELRLGRRYRVDIDGELHETDGPRHHLHSGERWTGPGIDVQALGQDDEPVSLLIRPDHEPPLLWAPQAGPMAGDTLAALEIALTGTTLGTAVLGPAPDDDPDEPRPVASTEGALLLARLRAIGVVDERTACLLVGLGHRQGPDDRLAISLEHWRAVAPVDGTRLAPAGSYSPGGRTLVLGGSASGKSGLAEDLLAAEPQVLYTATGPVVDLRTAPDAEWAQRIQRHRERRPAWWRTEETHLVAELLWKTEAPILLDSIGTWLTGVLDRAGAWPDQDGWRERVAVETDALVRAWRARRTPLVAVSDEVGLGVVPATTAGRLFRDELGRLNRRLADESDQVLIVVAGRLLATPFRSPSGTGVGSAGPGADSSGARVGSSGTGVGDGGLMPQ